MSLIQGERSIVEYATEFLRLSRYARALATIENEKCVRFEDGLHYDLRVLLSTQRERVFVILVDKAEIVEEVKPTKCERKDREKVQSKGKKDSGLSGFN